MQTYREILLNRDAVRPSISAMLTANKLVPKSKEKYDIGDPTFRRVASCRGIIPVSIIINDVIRHVPVGTWRGNGIIVPNRGGDGGVIARYLA